MVSRNIKYFNLRKIMNSGQIFRMYEPEPGYFIVYSGNRRLELRQDISRYDQKGMPQKEVRVEFCCTEEEFEEYWEDYFDLKRDYGSIVDKAKAYSKASKTSGAIFLEQACEYGSDIRVLKQDIWEMIISFIISQQKQIPSIRKCIEALCERFGEKHPASEKGGAIWYGFPDAASIAAAGYEGLKGLSLGYRERYIYETSVKFLADGISCGELRKMSPDEVKSYLCSFTGIGDKVADCVSLFGVGLTDAFPVDVHIKDILYREFVPLDKKKRILEKLADKYHNEEVPRKKILDSLSYSEYIDLIENEFSAFKGVRGIIQQWIFAYELLPRKR